MKRENDLRTVKEIASAIGRGRTFVQAAKSEMEEQGITWPLNMYRVDEFLTWCRANKFSSTRYSRPKKA